MSQGNSETIFKKQDTTVTSSKAPVQDKVTINDLLFPKATIIGIARNHETETRKMILTKDTQTALQRSSTVFLNYLMNEARIIALNKDKRSVNVDDVFEAIKELGFGEGFSDQLHVLLQQYNDSVEQKKKLRQQMKDITEDATDKTNSTETAEKQPDEVEGVEEIIEDNAQEDVNMDEEDPAEDEHEAKKPKLT